MAAWFAGEQRTVSGPDLICKLYAGDTEQVPVSAPITALNVWVEEPFEQPAKQVLPNHLSPHQSLKGAR